jgi:hypothetical protein
MERHLKNPRIEADGRAIADFDSAGVEEPTGPAGIFARLGVLLLIALAFGLAAQLLVGAPH